MSDDKKFTCSSIILGRSCHLPLRHPPTKKDNPHVVDKRFQSVFLWVYPACPLVDYLNDKRLVVGNTTSSSLFFIFTTSGSEDDLPLRSDLCKMMRAEQPFQLAELKKHNNQPTLICKTFDCKIRFYNIQTV